MVDTFSKEKRSQIMAAIHSRNTHSTERRLRAGLAGARISGWRMNVKELEGKPDFVFYDKKIVIFVDGCFWHGCECKKKPETNKDFWLEKFERNRKRDEMVTENLKNQGWIVVRIKEHELKSSIPKVIEKIRKLLEDISIQS